MNDLKTILALDVGERRIGVALASTVARLAAPLMTIDRKTEALVYQKIAELAKEQQAQVIVVGLPRNLNGQETAQSFSSRDFARELQQYTSAVIIMQDEAGTSLEAEELLKRRGKPYTKADIDAEAAALILRDYLQHSLEATA